MKEAMPATDLTGGGSIRVLRILVTALMVLVAIFTVDTVIALFTSDTLLAPLEFSIPPDQVSSSLPEGAAIFEADALLEIEAGFSHRVLWWSVTDVFALFLLAFLFQLRRILDHRSEPFTEENAKRLRSLVILTLVGAIVVLVRPFVSTYLQTSFGFETITATWDFTALAFPLLIGALLEVWRHGISLKTDQELTV